MVRTQWTLPLDVAGHRIRVQVRVTRRTGAHSFSAWVQPLRVEISSADGIRTVTL